MRSPVVAFVALLGLLCACVFGFASVTRAGVQCPTAPVQTLVVKDCCGRVVKRAPRQGDRVFVQCRCAEKKAASNQATAAEKVTLCLSAPQGFAFAEACPLAWVSHPYASLTPSRTRPPDVRPPTVS